MTSRQESLLYKLATVATRPVMATQGFTPSPEDRGPGFLRMLRRLAKYRGAYVAHVIRKICSKLTPQGVHDDAPARTFWGRELMLPSDDVNARVIRTTGMLDASEIGLVRYLIRELKSDSIFYDIGANYGFYTALAEEIVTSGEIHVFEPNQNIAPYLKRLRTDDRVVVNEFALSDTEGELTFFDCAPGFESGKSTAVEAVAANHRWNYRETKVQATTLDAYGRTHRAPTVIKMDVEGAELSVLQGGKEILQRNSPKIAIELWSGEELSAFSLRVLTFLQEQGYQPFRITEEGALEEVAYDVLRVWLIVERPESNFLFKKPLL